MKVTLNIRADGVLVVDVLDDKLQALKDLMDGRSRGIRLEELPEFISARPWLARFGSRST